MNTDQPEIRGLITAAPNPIPVPTSGAPGRTTLYWAAEGALEVEVRVGAPDGTLFARSGPSGNQTTGDWVGHGTTFFLQDVSNGRALTTSGTLAVVTVQHVVPPRIERGIAAVADEPSPPPVGEVDFGDLRRVTPISRRWGLDRGRPVDRYYIEQFLGACANDIHGRVVSIGDDAYVRRFGGSRVVQSEILDGDPRNSSATLRADLADTGALPSETFDCFICPQTLQYIYDVRAAVRTIHRMLKRGGVALVTLPGISPACGAWADAWCWTFTPGSARRLFSEVFPASDVDVEGHGNPLVATAFLMGIADRELAEHELGYHEPGYEIVTTVRAIKGENAI